MWVAVAGSDSSAAGANARANIWLTSDTGITDRTPSTSAGTSSRSGSFRAGMNTVVTPARWAASSFCLTPPIGSTRPFRVTSPVIATSERTGRPVRSDVAMTGEVTLNGRVLPIGGVKQKLLAAQRAGVTTVFIPARNEPDLDDVPAEVLEALTVHPVSDVAQILAQALEPAVVGADAEAAVAAAA